MKSAVFFEKAGQSVPEAVLKAAYEKINPVCLGIAACAFDDKSNPLIAIEHVPDLKAEYGQKWDDIYVGIKQLQDAMHEVQTVLVFADTAGVVTVSAEDKDQLDTPDMQPIAALTDNSTGHIHLVAILLGDFSQFAQKESKHTPEFFAYSTDLMPRLANLMEVVDNDLDKALAQMQKPLFTKDVQRLVGGDTGLVCIMSSDGTVVNVTKGDNVLKETDYGWTTLELEAPKAEEEPSKLKKLTGKFNFTAKKSATGAPPKNVADEPAKEQPKVDVPKAEPEPKKVIEVPADTAVKAPAETYVQAPSHLSTKNELREWYLYNAGWVPEGYRKRPKIVVKPELLSAVNGKSQEPDIKDLKQLDKVIEAKKTTNTSPTTPIIPADIRDELLSDAVVMKLLDKSSRVMPTLEQLDEIEKKYSTFSEQLGGDLELRNLHAWSFDDVKQFRAKFPDAADVLIMSLIWAYVRNYVKNNTGADTTKTTTEETKTPMTAKSAVNLSFSPKKKVA